MNLKKIFHEDLQFFENKFQKLYNDNILNINEPFQIFFDQLINAEWNIRFDNHDHENISCETAATVYQHTCSFNGHPIQFHLTHHILININICYYCFRRQEDLICLFEKTPIELSKKINDLYIDYLQINDPYLHQQAKNFHQYLTKIQSQPNIISLIPPPQTRLFIKNSLYSCEYYCSEWEEFIGLRGDGVRIPVLLQINIININLHLIRFFDFNPQYCLKYGFNDILSRNTIHDLGFKLCQCGDLYYPLFSSQFCSRCVDRIDEGHYPIHNLCAHIESFVDTCHNNQSQFECPICYIIDRDDTIFHFNCGYHSICGFCFCELINNNHFTNSNQYGKIIKCPFCTGPTFIPNENISCQIILNNMDIQNELQQILATGKFHTVNIQDKSRARSNLILKSIITEKFKQPLEKYLAKLEIMGNYP